MGLACRQDAQNPHRNRAPELFFAQRQADLAACLASSVHRARGSVPSMNGELSVDGQLDRARRPDAGSTSTLLDADKVLDLNAPQ